MSEFVDRMAKQRELLRLVNAVSWREELFSLSSNGIQRWVVTNQLATESVEVQLVREAAEALSFLAVRSQDQVSDDYQQVADAVESITARLRRHFGVVT